MDKIRILNFNMTLLHMWTTLSTYFIYQFNDISQESKIEIKIKDIGLNQKKKRWN